MATITNTNGDTSNNNTSKPTQSIYLQSMEELQKVFNQFDANKDGKISLSELRDVMKSMGSTYTDSDLQRVMEDIDTDHDGFISLPEFAALCKSSSSPSAELKDAFDLYDQDKNGLISAAELHLVLNRLGMKCSVDDCAKMIKSVDADGDGNVNYEEFQKMMGSNLANASGP